MKRLPYHRKAISGRLLWVGILAGVAFVMFASSALFENGRDARMEDTIGVVTKHGYPIPYAFTAPGLPWVEFDSAAAIKGYLIYLVPLLCVFYYAKYRALPRSVVPGNH